MSDNMVAPAPTSSAFLNDQKVPGGLEHFHTLGPIQRQNLVKSNKIQFEDHLGSVIESGNNLTELPIALFEAVSEKHELVIDGKIVVQEGIQSKLTRTTDRAKDPSVPEDLHFCCAADALGIGSFTQCIFNHFFQRINTKVPPTPVINITTAYNYWVSRALHAYTTRYLHNLGAAEGRTRVLRETMLAICAGSSSEDVQEALKRVQDVDKETALNAPISIAVRSGRVAAVQGCIQAGASVDLAVRSNIPSPRNDNTTLLDVAMNWNDDRVADILIKASATISHISQWPTTRRVYNVLHKAASQRTSVKLPGLRNFKHMSLADRKDTQY